MSSVAEKISSSIRDGILKGEIKPGEPLREQHLCNQFQVSRTPLREAFRILQSEGFLIHQANRGVIVNQISETEAMQLTELRSSLEIVACRYAAVNISKKELKELERLNESLLKAAYENEVKASFLDVRFHDGIAKAARNDALYELLTNVYRKLTLIINVLPTKRSRILHSYQEHAHILSALALKDEALASKYTEIHFHNSLNVFSQKVYNYVRGAD